MAPPGRIANRGLWNILGLRKAEWADLHIWFALVFVVVAFVHICFNWRPLLGYFKSRLSRRLSIRIEWLTAVGFCLLVIAGVRFNVPPFSSVLNYTQAVRRGWEQTDKPVQRNIGIGEAGDRTATTPVNQDEGTGSGRLRDRAGGGFGRQTLAEYCAAAGVDLAVARETLAAKGIQATPNQTLREIAEIAGFGRPSEIMKIIRQASNDAGQEAP